jgi:DNA topoisomerase IB
MLHGSPHRNHSGIAALGGVRLPGAGEEKRSAGEAVAKMFGNTPAICRKCYIHPATFNGYLDGTLLNTLKQRLANPGHGLRAEQPR